MKPNIDSALKHRVVPVAVIKRLDDAAPLAEALLEGGLPIIEVTLRTDCALDAIRKLRSAYPELIVGAGTVIDTDNLEAACDAGAGFAVSPGTNATVIERALERGLPILPGVITPTEVMRALDLGCDLLKFFPAESAGGAAMVKALAGPFAHTGVRFVPTGGINAKLAPDYLALPSVAAIGGSWFVDAKLVAAGDFKAIARLTREAVALAGAA